MKKLQNYCRRRLDSIFAKPISTADDPGAASSLRIAFVIPWFGRYCNGGAERECLTLVNHIVEYYPNVKVDVLSTTLKSFAGDWNQPYYRSGTYQESGYRVLRFDPTNEDRTSFGLLNATLMEPVPDEWRHSEPQSPLGADQEKFFMRHLIHSPDMYQNLKQTKKNYDFFIFIPYMFGTTYRGLQIVGDKGLVIPVFAR